MRIPLVPDQRRLAEPDVGLAELDPLLLRQSHQAFPRPLQQLGVGGEGDRLRLHRGVDNDPGEVLGLCRAATCGQMQALLQQRV